MCLSNREDRQAGNRESMVDDVGRTRVGHHYNYFDRRILSSFLGCNWTGVMRRTAAAVRMLLERVQHYQMGLVTYDRRGSLPSFSFSFLLLGIALVACEILFGHRILFLHDRDTRNNEHFTVGAVRSSGRFSSPPDLKFSPGSHKWN